ncbi:hypothetical protein ACFL2K_00430 [Candidatus Margulisiibacteriota bacterium]
MKRVLFFFLILFFLFTPLFASGGYDHGTPTGLGQIQLDFTWNPFDLFETGQTYVVWGYGITRQLDFHGYVSHEAAGTDQFYYGFMFNFFSSDWLDLSTAVGYRHRLKTTHIFFPQILYNFKFGDYSIGGSFVTVQEANRIKRNLGTTFDIAFFIPLKELYEWPNYVKNVKLGFGFFRPLSNKIYPTYSVDFTF